MRALNYVQRVSLDFTGTLFPHAICLGDADNDSLNELVVGDTSGKLLVYKNDESKPWITRTCVGMLTCVAVGDVCNKGKNFVVAVGAEGWFHLFDLTAATANKSDSSSQHEFISSSDDQKPLFTQHIPANTKVILISDIDGDGRSELVVGYTDRVVRAFRWEEPSESSDLGSGQLVLLKKWLLEGQVDSLSVNPGPEGLPELMVSQPGCGYAILLCSWTQQDSSDSGEEAPATPGSEGPSRDVVLHLTTGRIHNKNVSTHLIGSISKGSKEESSKCGLFALCTLDGVICSGAELLASVEDPPGSSSSSSSSRFLADGSESSWRVHQYLNKRGYRGIIIAEGFRLPTHCLPLVDTTTGQQRGRRNDIIKIIMRRYQQLLLQIC
ncbi:KICSTOR complex protein ITFG2 isoform X3 [Labrus mixtus]|uniref:KICSTOR complex protein ITFG2 isoform X3 n=1 Tax=Labrus mixtus TaxID=508554 RepID=UPI0029C00CB8|nr:KICSTOR complex protein ITFG2 isoform X3 [Labrus mixtus]